jgi:hypothetical protein
MMMMMMMMMHERQHHAEFRHKETNQGSIKFGVHFCGWGWGDGEDEDRCLHCISHLFALSPFLSKTIIIVVVIVTDCVVKRRKAVQTTSTTATAPSSSSSSSSRAPGAAAGSARLAHHLNQLGMHHVGVLTDGSALQRERSKTIGHGTPRGHERLGHSNEAVEKR